MALHQRRQRRTGFPAGRRHQQAGDRQAIARGSPRQFAYVAMRPTGHFRVMVAAHRQRGALLQPDFRRLGVADAQVGAAPAARGGERSEGNLRPRQFRPAAMGGIQPQESAAHAALAQPQQVFVVLPARQPQRTVPVRTQHRALAAADGMHGQVGGHAVLTQVHVQQPRTVGRPLQRVRRCARFQQRQLRAAASIHQYHLRAVPEVVQRGALRYTQRQRAPIRRPRQVMHLLPGRAQHARLTAAQVAQPDAAEGGGMVHALRIVTGLACGRGGRIGNIGRQVGDARTVAGHLEGADIAHCAGQQLRCIAQRIHAPDLRAGQRRSIRIGGQRAGGNEVQVAAVGAPARMLVAGTVCGRQFLRGGLAMGRHPPNAAAWRLALRLWRADRIGDAAAIGADLRVAHHLQRHDRLRGRQHRRRRRGSQRRQRDRHARAGVPYPVQQQAHAGLPCVVGDSRCWRTHSAPRPIASRASADTAIASMKLCGAPG
ncbi:MAG: hypothetical protein GAK31_02445 [Stenotrophomonas maltophilia]|uniref:Uncharacterized protein n=1 Tax=Stenotrophomonas maltophilia TaxID=40324 RepID=A0A7V8JLB2_STEMA|nr:MAG: hypothetical protein GAK31_02445 [Stenotrophomonas maltophilia]